MHTVSFSNDNINNETEPVKISKNLSRIITQSEDLLRSVRERPNIKKRYIKPKHEKITKTNESKVSKQTLPQIHSKTMKTIDESIEKSLWNKQHVNTSNNPVKPLHTYDWENEIAKHIVSMFATTRLEKENKDLYHSKTIVEFVDKTGNMTDKKLKNELFNDTKTQTKNHSNKQKNLESIPEKSIRPSTNPMQSVVGFEEKSILRVKSVPTTKISTQLDSSKQNEDIINETKELLSHNDMKASMFTSLNSSNSNSTITTSIGAEFKKSTKFRQSYVVHRHIGDKEDKVLRSPIKIAPIWYISTGEIYSDWKMLPNGIKLQSQLDYIYENQHYVEYIRIITLTLELLWHEKILGLIDWESNQFKTTFNDWKDQKSKNISPVKVSSKVYERRFDTRRLIGHSHNEIDEKNQNDLTKIHNNSDIMFDWTNSEDSELKMQELYYQLVLTSNAFAILSIEKHDYEIAMELLIMSMKLAQREEMLSIRSQRGLLVGYIHNTYAYYFHSKRMNASCHMHTLKAMELFELFNDYEGIAICQLQLACVEILSSKYLQAHKVSTELYI